MVYKLYNQKSVAIFFMLSIGAIYFLYNPADSELFPKCPFLLITGYQCPGCGSQRALHNLLNLNIRDAFLNNALMVISIPYILTHYIFEINTFKVRMMKWRNIFFGNKAIYIVFILTILFAIIRNLLWN